MKIHSIEWHEKNLKNQKSYLSKLLREAVSLKNRIFFLEQDIAFLEYQIEEAKKIGKDKFNRDKFRVSKGDKPSAIYIGNIGLYRCCRCGDIHSLRQIGEYILYCEGCKLEQYFDPYNSTGGK